MKVGKEGIVGVMAALEHRMNMDIPAWQEEQEQKVRRAMRKLEGRDGLSVRRDPDPNGNPFSRARVRVDAGQTGISAIALCSALADGDPTIRLRFHHAEEGYLLIDVMDLDTQEVDFVCDSILELLSKPDREKTRIEKQYGRQGSTDPRWYWLE